jgi:hypothetical protein
LADGDAATKVLLRRTGESRLEWRGDNPPHKLYARNPRRLGFLGAVAT